MDAALCVRIYHIDDKETYAGAVRQLVRVIEEIHGSLGEEILLKMVRNVLKDHIFLFQNI